MANYGAKVSQAGYDVKTATDRQLVFSSAFNTAKIVLAGSTTESGNAWQTKTKEITHSLGYVPLWLVFYKSSAGTYYKWGHGFGDWLAGDGGGVYPTIKADTSKLYVTITFRANGETITFYYVIFANQIET